MGIGKKQILLIEDDLDIHELLKELLEEAGFEVVSKWNGQEAWDFLQKASNLPALIFLDQQMPIMNGMQFRKLQLEDPQFARIPVVMITADGQIDSKLTDLGPVQVVKKPFELESILSQIDKALQKHWTKS